MNKKKDQIIAALKKLGASSPSAIADATGIEPTLCGYHLRGLLKAGAVTATGTSNSRLYALGGDGAAAASRAKRGGRGRKKRKQRQVRAPAASTHELFIPAVDAERRLILIDGSTPRIFSEAQTLAIATLLFQHYSA